MRKLIMMALAGFIWRKIQTRGSKQMSTCTNLRRY
jgi:hypothetical protein